MGRKPVIKDRTDNPKLKEEWIRKLLPVYTRKGLKKFSMDEVAAILEISKATLYKHFASREEIIERSLEVKLADMAFFKDALFNTDLPYIDRYFASISIFYKEIYGISTDFLSDLKHLYPNTWKKVDFFRDYAQSQLVVFYKEGLQSNLFNNVDPAILIMTDKWFFDAVSDPDFLKEHNLTLEKAFHDYFTLRCYGLFKGDTDRHLLENRINGFIQQLGSE